MTNYACSMPYHCKLSVYGTPAEVNVQIALEREVHLERKARPPKSCKYKRFPRVRHVGVLHVRESITDFDGRPLLQVEALFRGKPQIVFESCNPMDCINYLKRFDLLPVVDSFYSLYWVKMGETW